MQKNNYILLSRKYRPSSFTNLKGQDILVESLSYAILNNRIAQSYLLTGIRGVGKTTTARIIARTINCTNLKNNNNIPEACNECTNCKSSLNSSHPDIIEIDAASRTGVDDIRIIIENAEYKPMQGQFKVFIIDEVHMLSKSAFNALLKLLEEPPAHCLFIFATTEVYKIPLTIISRCQRFDLARFSVPELERLLAEICKKEEIKYKEDALKILSIKADGSARDALSLLDQGRVLAGSKADGEITSKIVNKMISAVDQVLVVQFLEKITARDSEAALKILEEFYKTNSDFNIFISDFLALLGYISKKIAIYGYISHEFYSHEEEIVNISKKIDMAFAQIAWQLTYKTQTELKNSLNQLEHIQMLALKLIYVLSTKEGGAKLSEAKEEAHKNIIQDSREVFSNLEPNSNIPKDDDENNFTFDDFLKFLHKNAEMNLYYVLFNKAEFSAKDNNIWHIKILSSAGKIEAELRQHITRWAGEKISLKLEYVENLTPHKLSIKTRLLNSAEFQELAKNFADAQITDILMRPN